MSLLIDNGLPPIKPSRGKPRPDDATQREYFYKAYDGIMAIDLPWKAKYVAFESMLEACGEVDQWPVIGITVDALTAIKTAGWEIPKAKIKRAHDMRRMDRDQMILTGEVVREDAFDFYRQHDVVTLTTAAENAYDGTKHWSRTIPLPIELFGWRTGFGVSLTKNRADYLAALARNNA